MEDRKERLDVIKEIHTLLNIKKFLGIPDFMAGNCQVRLQILFIDFFLCEKTHRKEYVSVSLQEEVHPGYKDLQSP